MMPQQQQQKTEMVRVTVPRCWRWGSWWFLNPPRLIGTLALTPIIYRGKPDNISVGFSTIKLRYESFDTDSLRTVACCWPSNLKTQVHGAKNLRPADVNGLADPFCASWPVGRERSIHRNLRVPHTPKEIKALLKDVFKRIIANTPVIRPYFMGGGIEGGFP